MNEYKLNCPTCGKERIYTCKLTFDRAVKTNTECNSCSLIKDKESIRTYDEDAVIIRKCPKCGKDIVHKSKRGFLIARKTMKRSVKRNVCCVKCRLQNIKGQIRNRGNANKNFKGFGDIRLGHFNGMKYGAKIRNIEFNISIQDAWNQFLKQNGKCALTNIELKFNSRANIRDGTASLDRINSSKPYTIDNIQWIHKDVNLMKNHLDQKYFIEMCNKISEYTFFKDTENRKEQNGVLHY